MRCRRRGSHASTDCTTQGEASARGRLSTRRVCRTPRRDSSDRELETRFEQSWPLGMGRSPTSRWSSWGTCQSRPAGLEDRDRRTCWDHPWARSGEGNGATAISRLHVRIAWVQSYTVNGRPLCAARIPLACQPLARREAGCRTWNLPGRACHEPVADIETGVTPVELMVTGPAAEIELLLLSLNVVLSSSCAWETVYRA